MARSSVGSVQDLGGGRWRLWASASPDPVSGKRRRPSEVVSAKNKTEAKRKLVEFLNEVNDGAHVRGTTDRTVTQMVLAWLANLSPTDIEGNTRDKWETCLRNQIAPHLGSAKVGKTTTFDLDQFYRKLERCGGLGPQPKCAECGARRDAKIVAATETGTVRECVKGHRFEAKGRPLSTDWVKECHAVLRLAFAQAVRWEWRKDNPALEANPGSRPRRDPSPPEQHELRRLIAEAERIDPDWACYLRVAATLGDRRGEGSGLRWTDVDLKAGQLKVRRAVIVVKGQSVLREYPKNASSRRTVSLDPGTIEALRGLRKRQRERALAFGTHPQRDGFVFSNEADLAGFQRPGAITTRFMRLRDRLDLGEVRLHDLRAYMATQLISKGIDVRTVAGRGGWSNPNTLLNTYAAWVPAADKDAAKLIGELFDAPGDAETDEEAEVG